MMIMMVMVGAGGTSFLEMMMIMMVMMVMVIIVIRWVDEEVITWLLMKLMIMIYFVSGKHLEAGHKLGKRGYNLLAC